MHHNKSFNSPERPKILNFYASTIVTSKTKNTQKHKEKWINPPS